MNHEMSSSQQLQEDCDPARSGRASLHYQIVVSPHRGHQGLLHSSSTDPERQMDRIRLVSDPSRCFSIRLGMSVVVSCLSEAIFAVLSWILALASMAIQASSEQHAQSKGCKLQFDHGRWDH